MASDSDWIGQCKIQSSTKSLIVECWIQSGRSLTYTRKRSRPKTVPWGMPEVTDHEIGEEEMPLIITFWDLSVKNELIQRCVFPVIPYHSNL